MGASEAFRFRRGLAAFSPDSKSARRLSDSGDGGWTVALSVLRIRGIPRRISESGKTGIAPSGPEREEEEPCSA